MCLKEAVINWVKGLWDQVKRETLQIFIGLCLFEVICQDSWLLSLSALRHVAWIVTIHPPSSTHLLKPEIRVYSLILSFSTSFNFFNNWIIDLQCCVVSAVPQCDSAITGHICSPSWASLPSPIRPFITECQAGLPVLPAPWAHQLPTPSSPSPSVHKSLLYIRVSIPFLQIGP